MVRSPCSLMACLILMAVVAVSPDEDSSAAPAPVPKPPQKAITNFIGMKLVLIPAGEFMMGSPDKEGSRSQDEGPLRKVRITRAFYMGVYEVTQEEYVTVSGSLPKFVNPSRFSHKGEGKHAVEGIDTSRFPVENVGYHAAGRFCDRLSGLPAEKKLRRVYRLPTEAEWEYACRAGIRKPYHFGTRLTTNQANFGSGGLKRTCKVGSFAPNDWGLYDMHGNVGEWTTDWYDDDYYAKGINLDPKGPKDGAATVFRGGSWFDEDWKCRSSMRFACSTFDNASHTYGLIGFRVVCDVP